jgi:hypothetical protein
MFEFSDQERAWHTEMRGISTDEHGREVLVGLTMEETVFYMSRARNRASGVRNSDPDNRTCFLGLHQKHELARLQVIGAEIELLRENPPRQ